MQTYHAIVEWSKEVTKRVWVARFKLDIPPAMEFLAGQYCSFHLKDNLRRTFSITTPPSQNNSFEICADVTPMGPGSVWLIGLKQGDHAEFLGPMGKFTLVPESTKNRVFIATGTGIAPIRSMIYDSLQQQAISDKREVKLYWGLRFEEDIFWHEEFVNLTSDHPHFSYLLTLSQPTDEWSGKRGYVTDNLSVLENLSAHDFYLCGNRGTIDSIKEFLLAHDVPQDQIKTELFF